METVDIDGAGGLTVERCGACLGLFFDLGEVELLLERSVSGALAVDARQLKTIGEERYRREAHVKYVRCPVCRSFMKRRVYGYRSGVVVDSCQAHGVWLDGGEVAHLLEWKKAGGELLQNRLFAQGRYPTQRPSGARDRADADAPTGNQDSSPRTGAAPLDSALGLLFRLFE